MFYNTQVVAQIPWLCVIFAESGARKDGAWCPGFERQLLENLYTQI